MMQMTLDQQLQLWNVIGTWLSSLGTVAAVVVALYLSRRVERIRLKVAVGLREVWVGDGSPAQAHVCFDVTNIGERAVTINTVGWAVGKRKKRKYAIQPVSGRFTQQYPIELAHGHKATFMVSLQVVPDWIQDLAHRFVEDLSDRSLNTLVAQIHTSVGQTIEIKPETELIEAIKGARRKDQP